MRQTTAVIRPYRPSDHAAVYDVCVRTADVGGDARGKYHSDDLMPDLFAGPYLSWSRTSPSCWTTGNGRSAT